MTTTERIDRGACPECDKKSDRCKCYDEPLETASLDEALEEYEGEE